MPSSLIFAALAAAWLVVLVPMFARRRQEVSKTTDSALAARVVRRGSGRRPATPGAATTDRVQEAFGMSDTELDDAVEEHDTEDNSWRRVHSDDVRAGRRYRPGRGGFDPEAAALAARAKYARRQRIVVAMLAVAIVTALVAALFWPVMWWLHGIIDLSIVGYLTYLRRQVHIEEDVRTRRLARMNGEHDEVEYDEDLRDDEYDEEAEDDVAERREARPAARAVRVEIDDEDPMFDELDERTWEPYRRAVGE
ncbi:divisome protein SepX/GlpR [Saccharopolyspora sp. NPDC002376]